MNDELTPEQDGAYQRLRELAEDYEDREFMQSARSPFMRTTEMVNSQEALSGADDRLWEAVRDARALGMDWSMIADATRLPEEGLITRYGDADRG
jgi:hypothetical protein